MLLENRKIKLIGGLSFGIEVSFRENDWPAVSGTLKRHFSTLALQRFSVLTVLTRS